jgi:hypothetical protein
MNMSKQNNLHVYSAGAVAPPIKKCAEEFKAKFGTEFARALYPKQPSCGKVIREPEANS